MNDFDALPDWLKQWEEYPEVINQHKTYVKSLNELLGEAIKVTNEPINKIKLYDKIDFNQKRYLLKTEFENGLIVAESDTYIYFWRIDDKLGAKIDSVDKESILNDDVI